MVSAARSYAAEDNTIKVALVGCGGRGTGAAANALSTKGPTKLWAMADFFANRLDSSLKGLTQQFGKQVEVPKERQFVGLDAYRKAIDCLGKGDVVLLATPAGFRPSHLEYAVEKGVHVFMEKSFAVDAPGRAAGPSRGRRGQAEEPQDRRRPDVAAREGPRGGHPADPRRRDRRRPHPADLPHARGGGIHAEIAGHERAGPPDPQL